MNKKLRLFKYRKVRAFLSSSSDHFGLDFSPKTIPTWLGLKTLLKVSFTRYVNFLFDSCNNFRSSDTLSLCFLPEGVSIWFSFNLRLSRMIFTFRDFILSSHLCNSLLKLSCRLPKAILRAWLSASLSLSRVSSSSCDNWEIRESAENNNYYKQSKLRVS